MCSSDLETDANYAKLMQALTDNINKIIAKIPTLKKLNPNNQVQATNKIVFNESNYIYHILNTSITLNPYEISIQPIGNMKKQIVQNKVKFTDDYNKLFLENKHLIVTIAKTGQILSILDKDTIVDGDIKTAREVLSSPGNVIKLHEDIPQYWDAWDVWIYYKEKFVIQTANSSKVIHSENYMDVQFDYKIGENSILNQTIRLSDDSRRIEMFNKIEWHEDRKFLRTYFPLNIRADTATFDIQNGYLRRNSTNNTSWDYAKYEVCGHKYCDMSESTFGASIISECKYGFSAKEMIISLSLMKSSKIPNPNADMGYHEFTYAFYPHNSGFDSLDLLKQYDEMVSKVWMVDTQQTEFKLNIVSLNNENVVLDALKISEDSADSIIMRIHEAKGSVQICKITTGFEMQNVDVVNIIEDKISSDALLSWDKNSIKVKLGPFQILTLKVTF